MFDRELAVRDNLGLVRSCASRFRGKGTDYDDLYQAGCMGLVKAAANYDESLGFRFSTYAVPVILGEIKRLFRDGGSFRVSRSLKELGLKARNARERFILEKGREPAVSELAELLCESEERVAEALCAVQIPLSLSAGVEDGDRDIPVDAPDERISELLSLRSELSRLGEDERRLIALRYFKSLTQTETARILGTTQVQISRREKKILSALRERLA